MFKRTYLFIAILLCISFSALWGQQKKVFDGSIEIWTNKETFFEVEEIPIRIRVTNNEEKGPDFGYIYESMELKDSQGKRYKPQIHLNIYGKVPMRPGIEDYYFNMIYWYGIIDKNHLGISEYLPPERYTIQCVWKDYNFETIYSNVLEFSIIPPNTREEEDALNLYHEAAKHKYNKEFDLAVGIYDELLSSYPNSVYSPLALNYMRFHYMGNTDKCIATCKRMLEEYPDSFFGTIAASYLEEIYKRKNNIDEIQEYFKGIREKIKNDYLRKQLDKIINSEN